MSEIDKTPLSSGPPDAPERRRSGMRNRLRRFFFRHVPLAIAGAVVLLALLAVGAYFVASSAAFENMVRGRLIAQIESSTGGRVEIASFHWHLLHLEAEADGLVIHGLEDPGDAPYAQVQRLRVQLSVLGCLSPRILLHDLEITQPSLHLIIYPDGSTNQPHPRNPRKSTKPALNTLFDLEAGHIQVDQGIVDIDNRAAAFDFQNRYAPLDFEARDVSMVMRYLPAPFSANGLYRIEAGAADLDLDRNPPRKKPQPVHGHVQLTLDLEPKRISLRELRLNAQSSGSGDRTLWVTGTLDDFTHPSWQARAIGDLDMRLLDPVTGYPDAPDGIAHLDLTASGAAGTFHIAGPVHVDGGSYVGVGLSAKGVTLDARIDADPRQLMISQIVARLRQGGQIEGAISLQPWLPGPAVVTRQVFAGGASDNRSNRNVLVRPMDVSIPVNGKVISSFKDVSLDTILDIVSAPQYRRLGLDALLNGPAIATWSNGDVRTIAVTANFGLSPSLQSPAGEAPTNGTIDATYMQRTGAVDLRKLELHLPASDVEASGALGAYPVTSPSAMTVDFHSHNLVEFDAVLRSLGLERNGKTGTAALPVALMGQADFHGSWTGSLVRPHLAGAMKATQIAVEMPAAPGSKNQPQVVRMDSVEATGSYSSSQIAIEHAQLLRGKTRIILSGSMDASPAQEPSAIGTSQHRVRRADEPQPAFDSNSVLHAHVEAANVETSDVQPFLAADGGASLPVEGAFGARIEADGPLHALSASGTAEMDGGSLYGEPLKRLQIQAAMAGQTVRVTSATLSEAAGSLAASGSYDLKTKNFQVDAHSADIDISRIAWIDRHDLEMAGKLGISITGSGTLDDPRLEAHATANALTLGGQQFGALEIAVHAASHKAAYNLTTQLAGADLAVHGETVLNGDYSTRAQLDFSRFNIGALFRMARMEAFSGESSLAGTITVAGPLAHPEKLYGDARLQELAVTVAGVKLQSEGGVHATLANDRIDLDPLHVTGEDTDLRAHGTLSLEGARQLDIAANGSVNLKLAETLDSDLTATGVTTFQVEAHGPLQHPGLQGRVDFQDASLSLEDLPNGLSQLRGTLEFNQNRLEVKSLTAMSGGGLLSVGGFLAYEHGIYADLSATGKQVHIRYPEGVSSLADAKLQLQGSQNNLQLSGDVLITRFSVNPDLDIAALALQANASMQAVAPPQAPSNHVRLDVHISSSPQLNFQNAFAKLAGDVNLHLRGTLASPSLLGEVAITEGSATIAGTRYDLERGDVTFTNPVHIEPVIDLSATAHVEDYDISLGLNGPLQKLAVTYRSDPPLPEADVVSLLALGHTANQQRLYTQQQEQSITNPTDALLGGALNATVSNRVQKLFGAGSVKVDPNYLGAFGNSTSRITVQEQFGRIVTLTYATDVNTTSQQLLQAEVAINRHVSLVVARDESGVFSMVVKATRRYR
jgi:translocation and assembly module TamB